MTTWVVDDDEWELDDDALVAAPAPPGTIGGVSWSTGPSTFTADDWSGLLGVDVVDVIGDIVVDASTGAALVIGTNVSDDELVRLVNSHVDRLRAIGPDVAQSVRDVLTMAVTSKLTPAEAAALIAAKGPLSEGRALNFARTELAAAANGGMDAAWRAAGVPFKRWRSMHDERVRDAHAAVDGQIVPTGETFRVGGRAARYPGDPNLPIELRVNCRCTMERIDADGRVRSDDFGAASRDDLRAIAQQLKVPRYSRMSKTQLRETIEDWSRGFGHQRLDQMSRVQLLQRAKQAGITGRHRMSKAELMRDLRQQIFATRTTTAVDRWRLDNGYVTRQEMGLDVRRAKADAAKAFKAPDQDVAPLDIQQSAALREQVWKRYEGEDRGHVGCASCGAKLTLDGEDGEPMALFRLNPKRGWEARNTIPVCASDATVMASRGVTGFEPRGFVASAGEMANPWHDERGRFARKGAYYVMTMPDGAAVSQREWFGKTLPGQTSVTVGGKQVAVIRNAVNFYGPSAGMQEGQPTGSSQDIDGDIAEIAAVAANVGTLYPEMRVTWITVADAPPARLAKYRGVAGTTDGENVELYARNLHDADGWAYFTGRAKDGPEGNYAMPSALSLTPTTYIAMHEMGHRHSNTMDDFDGRAARLFRSNSSQLSGYGRINWAEAYAEAFTEWHVTNGQTTNLDVQAWAAEFGWRTL